MMDVKRKTRTGRVISDKMEKTVIVAVDTPWRHPIYKKAVRRVVKYYAHDEKKQAKTGDMVLHRGDAPALQDEALARRPDHHQRRSRRNKTAGDYQRVREQDGIRECRPIRE